MINVDYVNSYGRWVLGTWTFIKLFFILLYICITFLIMFKKMGKVYLDSNHWRVIDSLSLGKKKFIKLQKNKTLILILHFSVVHIGDQYNCNSFQPDCLKPKAKVSLERVGGRHPCLTAIFFFKREMKEKSQHAGQIFVIL